MSAKSRRKGQHGEREVAHLLTDATGVPWKRGLQSRGGGAEVPDVHTTHRPWDRFHVEVKRTEKFQVWAAMAQAEADAQPGRIPVVVARRSQESWIVVMRLGPWLALMLDWATYWGLTRAFGGEE